MYPTNHVVGVLDAKAPVADAVEALTSGGFLDSEINVACGSEQADSLRDTTGRRGITNVAIRIAQKFGLADDEMEIKSQYEQAMRNGSYVVSVAAPTEERKQRASQLLRDHGAHSINFHGRFTIEGMNST